jgi:predicted unusual protein kinase regulating ubiquinone biosynthesis (AarF/ABC1/UbiB family)
MYNLYFQSQLAVASFQGLLKHVHTDCHWGNFLYHTNNESGYYHYELEGANGFDFNFYLKSCPYNLVIYDYGLANPISSIQKEVARAIYNDYDRISSAFNSKKVGWGLYKNLPSKQFDDKTNQLRSEMFDYVYQNMKTPQFDKLFIREMVRIFIKYAPPGLILENAPTNIINKSPFRFA